MKFKRKGAKARRFFWGGDLRLMIDDWEVVKSVGFLIRYDTNKSGASWASFSINQFCTKIW